MNKFYIIFKILFLFIRGYIPFEKSSKKPKHLSALNLAATYLETETKKMGKVSYMKLKGSQNLRLRLLLATLSSKSIVIEDIRSEATWPGLRPHEVSFLRLLEKICDDCVVEINETGKNYSAPHHTIFCVYRVLKLIL